MGGTRSDSFSWRSTASASSTKSYDDLYKNRAGVAGAKMKDAYDPSKITVRESRASDLNPDPTPIIIGLDGTGSMASVLTSALKNVGNLMAEIYDRLPVTDPHVMFQVFQDVQVNDVFAFQTTQFEADKIIVDQVGELYIQMQGGGNDSESYNLPLHFAINHTDCDAFKKGKKGFLFTIGDEGVPGPLTTTQLRSVYGPDYAETEPLSYEQLLEQAEENWNVFHVIVEQGRHMQYAPSREKVIQQWIQVLGQRVIMLADIDKLAEVLVATMQVISGADAKAVAASFSDPGTSVVVAKAIEGLVPASPVTGGVTRL